MATLTLLREGNPLSDPANQLRVLSGGPNRPVEDTLADSGLWPLRATGIRVLEVNQTQVAHCAPHPIVRTVRPSSLDAHPHSV